MKNILKFLIILLMLNVQVTLAQDQKIIDFYKTIRCLVCDGQSIYDSETQFSQNLREQIAIKFQSGKSKDNIKRELLKIYGEDISYEPTKKRISLWFFPFGILFLIFVLNIKRFRIKTNS